MVAASTRDSSGQGLGVAQQSVQCGHGRLVPSRMRLETRGMPKQKGTTPDTTCERHAADLFVVEFGGAGLLVRETVEFRLR